MRDWSSDVCSSDLLMKREPERKEALKHEFKKNLEDAQRRNEQAALRFAFVPSGL